MRSPHAIPWRTWARQVRTIVGIDAALGGRSIVLLLLASLPILLFGARAVFEDTRTLAIHSADMGQILADNYSLVEGLFTYFTGIIRSMTEEKFRARSPSDASAEERK